MIKLNSKDKNDFKVVFASNDLVETNNFLKDTKGNIFLSTKDNTIYVKLNSKTDDKRREFIKAFTSLVKQNISNVDIEFDTFVKGYADVDFTEELMFNALVETLSYVSHQPFTFKKEEVKPTDFEYNIVTSNKKLDDEFIKEVIKTDFTNYARDLQDTPPNIATSEWIAKTIEQDAKNFKNVKLKVLGIHEAEKLGMGLFLAVNAGSEIEPKVVVAEYNGAPEKQKTVLVGKGITFDSGGYNLKPSSAMVGMKFDMSGAAIMLSTVFALAKANAKVNVAAVGMFTDNRIGGHATLTESVVKSMNGLTVQIDNTDAEGRLVLADGMTYAVRELQADRIIEASTLTGAMVVALGHLATGGFTKSEELWKEMDAAQAYTGERVWRMPIYNEHLELMQATPIADLTNTGSRAAGAGSSTAAAFLNEFAEGKPFMHLDIAGTADNGERGTGVMVKTLFEMLNK
ncbi:M17 family metallopeptidase [Mesoplasma lactucae]|uniref:Probable cytosol aminopeptidase n=1 Tax=Mesoplasma lactucae ATCC 49193 TaxID=81460 RepID=A0A291ISC2_9MOLU|nr:peptidase M17 [Mesoplasma lactucae]ATG97782.1 peptidase M17 [Mesoplasma lactucae ATCC 49193]ATZ20441.1 leucyl aminopeptidase [Mesoplasma lactucae ATCC 49193]MCL8216613.1 cytosol aminopeptidase [Mesoplasma lactucae ATCC 49193]